MKQSSNYFILYLKRNGRPIQRFKQKSDVIKFIVLK